MMHSRHHSSCRNSNQVRIIGGQFRRRSIRFPDGQGLRPTPDRVRETVFNWLGQSLDGLVCLDLFAGSGALGFEAASRGAHQVVMVEKAKSALEALKENKARLQVHTTQIVDMDAVLYLKQTPLRFDVVFVDPPYDSHLLEPVLSILPHVLCEQAHIYIETRRWPSKLDGWNVIREGRAGQAHYGLLIQRE